MNYTLNLNFFDNSPNYMGMIQYQKQGILENGI